MISMLVLSLLMIGCKTTPNEDSQEVVITPLPAPPAVLTADPIPPQPIRKTSDSPQDQSQKR